MNVPAFTVIVPTYNRAHVLSRAIDSVLRQTYSDFELLVIDDGSSDGTKECVAKYDDQRIRYFRHETNLGQNQSLNTGIGLAQGEFISFLDSDDEWFSTMLGKVKDKFDSDNQIGCVYTSYGVKDTRGNIKFTADCHLEGEIYRQALELHSSISPPTALSVKKECFAVIGPLDLDIIVGQDDVMCLRLAKDFKFGVVREVLAFIHDDGGSQLSANREQTADDYYKICNRFRQEIIDHCGYDAMARRYTHAGVFFLQAENRKMAVKAFSVGLRCSLSFKGAVYFLLSAMPFYFQLRNANRRIRGGLTCEKRLG